MKPTLQLKIGQHLTMTPQLQQAIKLLQLSTLDLQNEIQEALDNNPLLEVNENENNDNNNLQPESSSSNMPEPGSDTKSSDTSTHSSEKDVSLSDQNEMPQDLPVDSSWEDTYPTTQGSLGSRNSDDEMNFDEKNSQEETLYDHLTWQLNLTPFTERDKVIALTIIESINTQGYLTQNLDILVETARDEWDRFIADNPHLYVQDTIGDKVEGSDEDPNESSQINSEDVRVVLRLIQNFDPPGVGATDLKECLLLQLSQLAPDTPWLKESKSLLINYAGLLAQKDFNALIKKTRLTEESLKAVLGLIKQLNPYPGDSIAINTSEYVVPDVIVSKKTDRWTVELNPGTTPNLRVNPYYANLKLQKGSDDKTYVKQHMQEAKWFIKSLQSRNDTLLKVATKIVEYQIDFFEKGDEFMKPLVLHTIAEAVEMHESTISRVTTQKYMHTPFGIFELKYFFSSQVSTDNSSTAIRAMIKKIIAKENTKKPYSDSKIASLLAEDGIKVARRTIAKYREALNIPPSNERKQLI